MYVFKLLIRNTISFMNGRFGHSYRKLHPSFKEILRAYLITFITHVVKDIRKVSNDVKRLVCVKFNGTSTKESIH